jgi:hemerythrin-like domain-containing protein
MGPIETLKDEHQVILRLLGVIERAEGATAQGVVFRGDLYEKALDFIANFTDRCHHCKEEGQLFPVLEAKGIPSEGSPIGCMLNEHAQGRQLIASALEALPAATAGDLEAQGRVRRPLMEYVQVLRDHIYKEDNILFMMASQVLTPEDLAKMEVDFKEALEREVEPGVYESYRAMVGELETIAAELESAAGSQAGGQK